MKKPPRKTAYVQENKEHPDLNTGQAFSYSH